MEAKIKELPEVHYCTVTFATKQLRLSADDHKAILPKIQEICASIEPDVTIVPRQSKKNGVQTTKTYILENLGCANCASKIEKKLNDLDEVTNATITFATKQLKLTAKNPDVLLPQVQKICTSVESEIVVVEKDPKPAKADDKKGLSESAISLISIIIGAILFVIGLVMEKTEASEPVMLGILIVAYIILGGKVLMTALKNMTKGQIFDENFLMSIATIGAFAIHEYPEAVGVMLFYRIGEYFEDMAVARSRSQIMEAVDLRPEVVNLVIGEEIKVIDAANANVGDILLIRPGDRIPLDGVIIDGESRIDTSPITGEPVPITAKFGDEVTSGCVNTSGQLKIRVEKVLEESMVTRILDSVENAAANKPQIDKFITRFARVYTPFVVFFAIAVAIVPPLLGGDWGYWVKTALTFLVISCPCALVLSVPLAFFSGIGAGSKKGILFKGGQAIEALRNVHAVVMDKTGTITKGNFVVQKAVPANDMNADELLAIAASCELSSTHPIGNSIVIAAKEKSLEIVRPAHVEELAGMGIKADLTQGTALCGNRKLMDAFNIDLSGYVKTDFGTEVLLAFNGKFAGNIIISDTLKEDAVGAIKRIKAMGIVTAMLTGDAQDSAEAVAAQTGIDEVHAKLLPQDKLNELGNIRERHGNVMFVGDGINDAPVLAGADVGAAMGSGADAAIEAADVVFMTSNMEAIPQSIDIAKATSRISWQNVYIALGVKAIVMLLGLFGYANLWMAVFADTGVSMICLLNSIRILYRK
jgi:Cd2+/Zn2+-exporting ATPase